MDPSSSFLWKQEVRLSESSPIQNWSLEELEHEDLILARL